MTTSRLSVTHKCKAEKRPATCCQYHSDWWGICSCGWEHNFRNEPPNFLAHQVAVLAEAVGIKFDFGGRG